MIKRLLIMCLLCMTPVSFALEDESNRVAKEWLQLVDSSAYQESWEKADALFQAQISAGNWKDALNEVRSPLGKVISREKHKQESVIDPPQAPSGTYNVIQYKTRFEQASGLTETVTVTNSSGDWKVVGYLINE